MEPSINKYSMPHKKTSSTARKHMVAKLRNYTCPELRSRLAAVQAAPGKYFKSEASKARFLKKLARKPLAKRTHRSLMLLVIKSATLRRIICTRKKSKKGTRTVKYGGARRRVHRRKVRHARKPRKSTHKKRKTSTRKTKSRKTSTRKVRHSRTRKSHTRKVRHSRTRRTRKGHSRR